MSERGKKVNKNNPANRAERRTKKTYVKERKKQLISNVTEGIAPRTPIEVTLGGGNVTKKCATCNVDLTGPDTKHKAKKHTVQSGPNKGMKIGFDPATGDITQDTQAYTMPKAEDLGKTGQARAARGVKNSIARLDEKDIAEARREKTPSEQAEADAAATGVSVEELMAVKRGDASFIDQKPTVESKFEPVNIAVPDIDQPKGQWSPSTKTGIFTPAPTGAVRGNRAQPTLPAVQENTEGRIASGMGLPGMQEGSPTELIKHPVHGDMEVPADIARAHRLYDLDWQKNSGRANRLAGLTGSEDYASPYAHKGKHYERLGRLQAAGENIDDISAYARKMGMTEYDVVESRHAMLQDKLDSRKPVDFGLQHFNENDTFTHPETGTTHPMSEWETQGMHIKTPALLRDLGVTDDGNKILETAQPGVPSLIASKGTNTSIYKDSGGNIQTTVPTHIGWWKTPTDKDSSRENLSQRPGNWTFKSGVIPLDANPQTAPVPAYDFTLQQTREALPMGSKQSRAEISEAARAMAQIAAASGVDAGNRISQTQVTDPNTGRALDEPNTVSTPARPTYKTTDTPAEDTTVYKRKGRGKKVIKDVNHLVSQQMATTVGSGPETATGDITRNNEIATTGGTAPTQGRSRGFVPAPVVSYNTDGASAFQPGKAVVAGTAAENKALSEKLRDQEENTGKTGGRGFGNANDAPVEEPPAYRVDALGNPIPNPPTVGVKGAKRLFVRSRSATGNLMPKPLQKFFEPLNAPAEGAEGPQVTSGTSGKPARRNKRTGAIIDAEVPASPGRTAYATPFSPSKAPLTQSQQWIQAAMPTDDNVSAADTTTSFDTTTGANNASYVSPTGFGKTEKVELGKSSVKPMMTNTEAQKYSRISLQDNPSKGPAQPMLDFGQLEREEENRRKEASAANGGVDVTTGLKFKRSGQQWGFLDPRWLGDVGTTNEDLATDVSQENRAKGSEHPRAVVPAPGGLPKAGPKSAPVDTDGAGPAAIRILGEMHGSKQLQAHLAYVKGGNPELNDIIDAKRSGNLEPEEALGLAQDAGHLPRTPRGN